jgi:hypothetical protein
MPVEHTSQIHSIELVSTENDVVIGILVVEVSHVLSDSISSTLVPGISLISLLCSKNLDKPVGEGVENIGVGDMVVKGGRVELGEDVNLPDFTIDTV